MLRFSQTVLRNSAVGLTAQLAIKLISFGFSVLVVRHLGAETFGQYAAVVAFGSVFIFMADLGLSPYAVRQIARLRDTPEGREQITALFADLLVLRFLLSVLTAVLLTTAAWLTGRPLVMVLAIVLNSLALLLYSVQGTSEAVLGGYERLDLSSGAKVIYQVAFVLVGAGALLLGAGYYGLIFANLLAVGLLTLTCWRNVRALNVRPGHITARNWPTLLRASLPFGVIGLALGLSYKFDTVLLNIFRSDLETGYYGAAYNLVFSTVVISNVVNTALYPSLTRASATSPHALPRLYERTLLYLLTLSLPIAVGAWALAPELVPFLFGDDFRPAILALQIVIWVVPLMFASEFLGYVVLISGREQRVARAVLVSTGINVGLNLLLVPWLGLAGAAVMTVVTEAILVGQHAWTLRSLLRQISWQRALVRPLLAAVTMGAFVLLARHVVPLLALVGVGAAVYAVLLLGLGVLGKDEIRFLRNAMERQEPRVAIGGSD